mgnify:CR=1 FL=1|tara:strand:- start:658 stop:1101 length:444 start_codon:yes stop_codon:yes gene_type:complete
MSFVFDIAAAKQAKAAGKYNQAVQERNATIAEQEAGMVEKQLEFDIGKFDQQFVQLQGETKTSIYKSGVEMSGSGLRILRYNAEQAEIQKDVMDYNAKVAEGKKLEEANFARIQGQVARQQAKIAELGYYAKAGQSLMTLGSGGAKK